MRRGSRAVGCVVLAAALGCEWHSAAAGTGARQQDLRFTKVAYFQTDHSTLWEALQKLARGPSPFAFGLEQVLKKKYNDPPLSDVRFSMQMENKTLAEVLDSLCRADPRYTWSLDTATINIYPRSATRVSSYLLNRKLAVLRIKGITHENQGLLAIAQQLPPPAEQLAQVEFGASGSFPPRPWTATFRDLTVRQAVNRLAAHMGPYAYWLFYGSEDFREFAFYQGAVPRTMPAWTPKHDQRRPK